MHRKQLTAAKATIKAAGMDGVDPALAMMVLGLAKSIDEDPSSAPLWREYRLSIAMLRQVALTEPDEEAEAFIASLRTPGIGTPRTNTPRTHTPRIQPD